MAHSIFVRDLSSFGNQHPKLLAYAIPCSEEAEKLVRRLAGSYPLHGFDRMRGVFWFRDSVGLHEIWARPEH